MRYQKTYEANDKMISLIKDNYNLLQTLGRFNINLGFGDKTVREVCEDNDVDCATFLAIINFTINDLRVVDDIEKLSVPTLLHYLKASHTYYLDFQLPFIRKELCEALNPDDGLGKLILRFYDEYAAEVRKHMRYEEKTVFPYVENLLEGKVAEDYDIETFSKHHGQVDTKLRELKSIIIKYLPGDSMRNNMLSATLYDIYNNEEWLVQHSAVEENIFIPAIRLMERKSKQCNVSVNISRMINPNTAVLGAEVLSDREKDVIVALVQGMSNKEIADHLFISVNTVITHRRNIAKKLQIHSPAGLTIYAIVNGLVDITSVKL